MSNAKMSRRLGERPPGFAGMLIAAREDAELTQAGLARAVGCSRRQLARFESGAVLPSLLRFAKLRRVLGFDVNPLLAQLRDDVPREPFYGFGQVVAAARTERSLSRVQVAQSARCELEEYQAIERGELLPSMGTAVRIHAVVEFDANAAMRWVWRSGAIAKVA